MIDDSEPDPEWMLPDGDLLVSDPCAWALNRRIETARDAAKAAGETLHVPTNWRAEPIPLATRETLARWFTTACVRSWETDCEAARAAARAPFSAYASAVAQAIPRRYSEARPLPAKSDPDYESVRAMLQLRVKSTTAYKLALAAATGIAEGRVRQVLLVGPSGAGKSTIAAIMLRVVAAYFADRWEQTLRLPQRPIVSADDFVYVPPPKPYDVSPLRPRPRMRELPPSAAPTFGAWAKLTRREGQESPVQWVTARDLFRAAANPTPPRFGEEPRDPLAKWKRAPLTLLDDIGGEPEQRNVEAVDGVLWHRHDDDDDAVTITTSGFYDPAAVPATIEKMSEDELQAMLAPLTLRYGAALVRRIAEPGQAVVIPVIPRKAA